VSSIKEKEKKKERKKRKGRKRTALEIDKNSISL